MDYPQQNDKKAIKDPDGVKTNAVVLMRKGRTLKY